MSSSKSSAQKWCEIRKTITRMHATLWDSGKRHVAQLKQGHHHNGGQAARRPDMVCIICGRRFTNPLFGTREDRDDLIRQSAHVFLLAPY